MEERLQKLMAQANIGSRRVSEQMIQEGRVRVNGKVATLGQKANPETDVITVDGERLKFETKKRYIVFNKPMNVLSTNVQQPGDDRPTVRELIPAEGHLFTIGRLDADSEGLMVLTNDGDLANKLAHPRYEHTKTYKVVVYGKPSQETLDRWEKGVYLEEGLTSPCSIRVQSHDDDTTTLRIVMTEGRKRQIRRVAALMGHNVKKLTRTFIGKLGLGTLKRGQFYDLSEEEVKAMLMPADDLTYIRRLRRERRQRRKPGMPEEVIPREAPESERFAPRPRSDEDNGEERRPRRSLVRGFNDEERPARRRDDDGIKRVKFTRDRNEERPKRERPAPVARDFDRDERPARRRDDDDRPPRRTFSGDRPRSGEDRPPRRRDDDRSDRPRRDSDDRPPRRTFSGDRPRSGEDRPPRRRDDDRSDRPRRDGDDRPPRRTFSGDRPRSGDDRPPRRRDDDRSDRPRRDGDDRPPRRTFSGDRPRSGEDRPPRRRDDDRSDRPRRDGDDRPPRRTFSGDRPRSGDDRPPRRPFRRDEGGDERPRQSDDERPRRPFRRDEGGDDRPPRRTDRPQSDRPRRDNDDRPARRRDDDDRPARRRDDDRPKGNPFTRSSDDKPKRRTPSSRPGGGSRPPRKPSRPGGGSSSQNRGPKPDRQRKNPRGK